MTRVLVTGATGNIGIPLVKFLQDADGPAEIIAAARSVEKAQASFAGYPKLSFRGFDFENSATFAQAFKDIGILFLLRPPHISQVEPVFRPLLQAAQEHGIKKVVFLSVQGAENSKIIPHNKIERIIVEMGFDYIFVRPSYFMQNLSTSLRSEIQLNSCISLPAGQAKFNWIDVENIAQAAAFLITHFEQHQNEAYTITGAENLSFGEVAEVMSATLGRKITYRSINPLVFYFKKRREGLAAGFALVMTILHLLPRFQDPPQVSSHYQDLTKSRPTRLKDFIEREKDMFNEVVE